MFTEPVTARVAHHYKYDASPLYAAEHVNLTSSYMNFGHGDQGQRKAVIKSGVLAPCFFTPTPCGDGFIIQLSILSRSKMV